MLSRVGTGDHGAGDHGTGELSSRPVLEVEHLFVRFGHGRVESGGVTIALNDVSLRIHAGERVGIVGESGSGKTTLLRVLAGLTTPDDGTVRFNGNRLDLRKRASAREFRSSVQLLFQDPGSSLDPRRRVWESVSEPAWALNGISRTERRSLTLRLLSRLGLPQEYADRRPHQLSGGERQRVALARALSTNPQVVLLDEPVASLDASRRGQVINLINELAHEMGIATVVVSHDMVPIALLTETVVAMYRGKVVEAGATGQILQHPAHPYTRLLIDAVKDPLHGQGLDEDVREQRPEACPYATRCPEYQKPVCDTAPPLSEIEDQQLVACHMRTARPGKGGKT